MNRLSDYRKTYEEASSKVSDITRQMALAGIAIVWIFRQVDTGDRIICQELILPLIFFVASLFFDILQYLYKTIAWYVFFRINEKNNHSQKTDPLIQAKPRMNYPTWALFYLKVLCLVLGYIFVFIYLIDKLFL
jgi:hypothetical protein